MGIYLDYNASAPIDMDVLNYMNEVYKGNYGNPDSRTHDYGEHARSIVENAREKFARLAGTRKDEVFFTSGATEANNIAIRGLASYGLSNNKKHIIVSAIEHKAVLESANSLIQFGFEIEKIYPDKSGRIKATDVERAIREDTLLVSVMHVNNETGVIQPVDEIGEFLSDRNVFFHVDATQSFGKLVEEVRTLKYDMMTMSAHKLAGPQGVGALILKKKRYKLPPVQAITFGGDQEHGIRPGTVPTALVAGLGRACEIAEDNYKQNMNKYREIREKIFEVLRKSDLQYSVNGEEEFIMPNTLNLCLYGVSSEALMLSSKQHCGISNGSACNSHKYEPSYVLRAMGIPDEQIDNSIRISWGVGIDSEVVKEHFEKLIQVAEQLVIN